MSSKHGIITNKLESLKTKRDFLFFFTLPIICLALISCTNIILNFRKTVEQTKQSTSITLSTFSKHCEYKINSVINNTAFLESSPEVLEILNNANMSEKNLKAAYKLLKNLKNSNPIIEEAAILCSSENRVISSDGEFTFEEYFDKNYIMDNYPSTYFKNFRIYDSSSYRILPPVMVTTPNSSTGAVSSILIRKMSQRHRCYIFVSISMDKLLKSDLESLNFTKNSEIYVLNTYSGMSFSNSNTDGKNIFSTELYDKLAKNTTYFKEKSDSGESYHVFSYTPSKTILGYVYYTVIPSADLYNKYNFTLFITVIMTLITIIYAFYFTAKLSRDIYLSFKDISTSLVPHRGTDKSLISGILESATALKNEYTHILSYAQEKYIIDYMNGAPDIVSADVHDQISKNLPFNKRYFISTIFKISPTDKLSMLFDKDDAEYALDETFNLLKSIWLETTDCFFISSEKNTLYVLINTNERNIETLIEEKCRYISDILKYDSDLINLIIGRGTLEYGIDGLKNSHTAATNNLINVYSQLKIRVPSKTHTSSISYQSESKLFISLIEHKCDRAIEIIDNSVNALSGNADDIRNIYSEIIDVIFKALRVKGIRIKGDTTLYEARYNMIKQSIPEIRNTIITLINEFSKDTEEINYDNIIEYIKDNCTNPMLSLDFLSEKFNNESKYLSALIKSKLGIGFHDYLTNLRIDKVKELLETTNLNQQEIFERCGFTNRQTFSRAFKKITGITPSEYKKLHLTKENYLGENPSEKN